MLLACNNITKSFGDVTILDQVSFHINEREKMAIVGINGAGKSTLLKIIMQELSADSGEDSDSDIAPASEETAEGGLE